MLKNILARLRPQGAHAFDLSSRIGTWMDRAPAEGSADKLLEAALREFDDVAKVTIRVGDVRKALVAARGKATADEAERAIKAAIADAIADGALNNFRESARRTLLAYGVSL